MVIMPLRFIIFCNFNSVSVSRCRGLGCGNVGNTMPGRLGRNCVAVKLKKEKFVDYLNLILFEIEKKIDEKNHHKNQKKWIV